MNAFELYVLLKLDTIHELFVGLSAAIGFVIITSMSWALVSHKDGKDAAAFARRIYKPTIPLFIIFLLSATLLPSTKQMAVIMVVPPLVEAVSNNEELKKLPDNIVSLANEWLQELKPQKTKE